MSIDVDTLFKAMYKCPLKYTPSRITTPLTIYEVLRYNESPANFLIWCDDCRLCGEKAYRWLYNLKVKYKGDIHKFLSKHVSSDYNVFGEGEYILYISKELYEDSKDIYTLLIEDLKRAGIDIEIALGPDTLALYSLSEIGYTDYLDSFIRFIEDLPGKLVYIDRYTNLILSNLNQVNMHISLARLLRLLIKRGELFFKEAYRINIYLLDSPYSFYKTEARMLASLLRLFPNLQIFVSKRMYGVGSLHYYSEDLAKYYVRYIDSKLPKKMGIIATADPYLYRHLYKYSKSLMPPSILHTIISSFIESV